ncbi:MAG: hypothetical protein ACR2NO_11155 [Chloroflexota bacterium]
MAGTHSEDPNAAPMHHDIKERFETVQVVIAGSLGMLALIAGIVAGLLFVND